MNRNRLVNYLFGVLCITVMVITVGLFVPESKGQYKTVYNPFTKKQDYVGGEPGPQGPAGPAGPAGPSGSPNTSITFTDETDIVWTHNENVSTPPIIECWDTTVSPPKMFQATAEFIDANTAEIKLAVATTGLCVGNFSGGAGGGNPLWANIQAGTSMAKAFLIGNGGTFGPTGTGKVRSNEIPSGGTMLGSLIVSAISEPGTPDTGTAAVWIDSGTGLWCSKSDTGAVNCVGAPGGGSVTLVQSDGGVETIDDTGVVGNITTTGKVRATDSINVQSGTTYTVLTGDRGKTIFTTNSSAKTLTLPQAGTDFPAGWFVDIRNASTATYSDATVNVTTSTVDGLSSLSVGPGMYARILSDGTNYRTQGLTLPMPNGSADGTWFAPWGEFHDVTSGGLTSSGANKVYMFYFQVRERPVKISKATFRILTASAGTHMAMAIYSSDSSKIDETASALSSGSNGDIRNPAFSSTLILNPGLYILAYAADNTTQSITTINSFPATTSLWNFGGPSNSREWTCANPANFSGGAIFPITCGAHSPYSASGPPILILEN